MFWRKNNKVKLSPFTNNHELKDLDFNSLPILTSSEIVNLLELEIRLNSIKILTGAGKEHYELLYLPAIEKYIESVQLAPASASHHHSGPGGLVVHTLEVIEISLRKRKSYNLPIQSDPELISLQEHVWTYGVFAGALLHDIGKLICSTRLILNTGEHWSPHDISILETGAVHYKVRFEKSKYKLHTQLSNGFFHILPAKGRGWLAQYSDVLAQLTAWLSGDVYEYGVIGEIIRQADGESVAKNLRIGAEPQRFPNAPTIPLVDRLTTALRQLLEEGRLKINRPEGSAGWCDDEHTYLVCGSVADSVRNFLNSAGANDIPTDNSRIFDTWQEYGFIESTPDDGSIWYLTINNKFTLTVLKFETIKIFHPSCRPEPFAGILVISDIKPSKSSFDNTNVTDINSSTHKAESIDNSNKEMDQNISIESVSPCHTLETENNNAETNQVSSNNNIETNLNNEEIQSVQPALTFENNEKSCDNNTDDIKTMYVPNTRANAPTEPYRSAPNIDLSSTHSTVPDTLTLDDPDIPQYFIEWIKSGIKDKSIGINNKEALIHIVKEGALIVSPKAFKSFSKEFNLVAYESEDTKHKAETNAARKIQNKLEKYMKKSKLHRKTTGGRNIHTYLIQGQNRESKINGWLVPLQVIYGDNQPPKPNKVLTNITGFKDN